MFEKVNPSHPDKVADRIAGASLNIYCHLKAKALGKPYELACSIGNTAVDGRPYSQVVEIAREYIEGLGGFEKFAEWFN